MSKLKGKSSKADAERFQHQLLELLKDEPNRVCADCKARGPRWASWNLGVFICIRCAGIHRNLGVHIARVKSVNLDTWTQEQVDNMLAWGNGVANEYYEYKLPSDFRRPKDDPAVDKFIKSKYEKKLYIHENFDYASSIKSHAVSAPAAAPSKTAPAAINAPVKNIPVIPLKKSDAYVAPRVAPPSRTTVPSLLQVSMNSSAPTTPSPAPAAPAAAASSTNNDLFDLFGDMVSAAPPPEQQPAVTTAPVADLLGGQEGAAAPKTNVKDSIMSLYGNNTSFARPAQQAAPFPGMQGPGQNGQMFANKFSNGTSMQFPQAPQQQQFGTNQQFQQMPAQQFSPQMQQGFNQQPGFNQQQGFAQQQAFAQQQSPQNQQGFGQPATTAASQFKPQEFTGQFPQQRQAQFGNMGSFNGQPQAMNGQQQPKSQFNGQAQALNGQQQFKNQFPGQARFSGQGQFPGQQISGQQQFMVGQQAPQQVPQQAPQQVPQQQGYPAGIAPMQGGMQAGIQGGLQAPVQQQMWGGGMQSQQGLGNQQQHLQSIQNQLQMLKVGAPQQMQAGWGQQFGTG